MGIDAILSVQDVRKTFGAVKAVDGVSFDVARGKITGLLGRNGAGKTTTLRMINGIFLPDTGVIRHAAVRGDAHDHVGYLPEERGLYKKMKVLEHLLFLAEIKGAPPAQSRPRAERWLERLDLSTKRDAKVEELSKGNQQKVQLIGTLLHEPDLVILDEPMSGLDPVNVVIVRGILEELSAQGRTVLLSTHMMGEAERMVDDLVLIHEGRVVLHGSLDAVKASYGRNTLQLAFGGHGDPAFLAALPGVARANVTNNEAELSLDAGVDPQPILEACVGRLRLTKFLVAAPSLEEIFIDRVGKAGDARSAAPAPQGAVA
ncbi:MAG: ATP-binding cassette domain-containing protein [Acidobacteriota bacterium]